MCVNALRAGTINSWNWNDLRMADGNISTADEEGVKNRDTALNPIILVYVSGDASSGGK